MPKKKHNSALIKVSREGSEKKPQNVYFLSLELENVRCFSEKQKIDFSDGGGKPKQWTIILGDNGTGKTTILQCLAAIMPQGLKYYLESSPLRSVSSRVAENTLITTGALIGNALIPGIGIGIGALVGNFFAGYVNYANAAEKKAIKSESRRNQFLFGFAPEFFIGNSFTDKKGRKLIPNWRNEKKLTENLEDLKNLFVLGYGASRTIGSSSLSSNDEIDYCESLFSDKAYLGNAEEWLLQADYTSKSSPESKKASANLNKVKSLLCKILPGVKDIQFTKSSEQDVPKVEFDTDYGWVSFKDLSLGYRTVTAWMIDLASKMFKRYPESENPLAEPAVVLIDEIDLHLHPKWQRDLIDYLTNLFPQTQFIVTTHSPLIVQAATAENANIVICRQEGDHALIEQNVEAVKNWRTDQILTSELFDLPTARPKNIEPLLKERQEILSKPELSDEDKIRLEEIKQEIGFMPVSQNIEDDKAMEIIRRAAEQLQSQFK